MRQSTNTFRERYRAAVVPARYHGQRHIAFVIGGGVLLGAAPWWILDVSASIVVALATIAATLVIASLVEYLAHRFVMHRPRPGLRAVYHRHTRQHHRYFRRDDLFVDRADDLHATLFPPLLLGFFAVIASLLALLVAMVFSLSVAAAFFSTSIAYYLLYEVMHASAHVSDTRLKRPRCLQRLNALHRSHHEPAKMQQANFNIVLPLGDWLFGTLVWPATPAEVKQELDSRFRGNDERVRTKEARLRAADLLHVLEKK